MCERTWKVARCGLRPSYVVSALAQTQVNGALDKEYFTHARHTWQRVDVVEFPRRLCGPTEIH